MPNLCLSGRLYDRFLELLTAGIKREVGNLFIRYELFPALDICCGTGTQLHILQSGKNTVFGLDLNLPAVKYAAYKYPEVHFLCADATQVPLKEAAFKGIILSFSLHEKVSQVRHDVMNEVKKLLAPRGKIIFVDFEKPWNRKSRMGAILVYLIEKMAGREHFRNNRQFLKDGALRSLIQEHKMIEIMRKDIEWGALAIVVAGLP